MTVKLRPGESQENLLKRFRKEVSKSRVLSTYRKKQRFVSKSELERKKKKKASRKLQRKLDRRRQRQERRGY